MQALPIITAHATLCGLRALGYDADAFADTAGLPSAGLMDPFATVPSGVFGRLWMLAFEADPRPHLPVLVGCAVPYGAFGLLDYLVGSAPTVGQGLAALARYFRLVATTVRLDISDETHGTVWIENDPPSPTDIVSDAFTIAVIASRFGTRVPFCTPHEVHLTHPMGPPVEPYERALGCRVFLGKPQSGIRFPSEIWLQPLTRAEPALHSILSVLAERADVRSYITGPISYAIRLRLPETLQQGKAGSDQMAASLNMSLRTLQRRLAREGTSFEALLDDFRREEAARLLRDRKRPISEVARHLGYLEPASFTRAFRRWFRMSPSVWRQEQQSKD